MGPHPGRVCTPWDGRWVHGAHPGVPNLDRVWTPWRWPGGCIGVLPGVLGLDRIWTLGHAWVGAWVSTPRVWDPE